MEVPAASASAASVRPQGKVAPDGSVSFVRQPLNVGDTLVHEHSHFGWTMAPGSDERDGLTRIWRASANVSQARDGAARRYTVRFDGFESYGFQEDGAPKTNRPYLVWAATGEAQGADNENIAPDERRFFARNAAFLFAEDLPRRLDGQTISPGMRAPAVVDSLRAAAIRSLSAELDMMGHAWLVAYEPDGAHFEFDVRLLASVEGQLHTSRWMGAIVVDVGGRPTRESVKTMTVVRNEKALVYRAEATRESAWSSRQASP